MFDALAGQNMVLMKCVGINGTGLAKILMATNLLTPPTKTLLIFALWFCHPWCHAFAAF
jgi:hypothetical protein